jgi:two-component system NtrC family sensor kinase
VPAVLIVATSDLTPELGRTVLWRSGVERAFAVDPQTGFEAARALAPKLVVLDAATVEEAVSFVRRLRQDPDTRPTAIAVLSHSIDDEEPLRQAGANVVLSGQVDPALWDRRLEELLTVPPRLEARIPVRMKAWSTGFVPGKELIEGATVNLSVRGALLETTDHLEVGTKLDIGFKLPGSGAEVKVVGQVAREAASGEGGPRSAVKFLVLRDDARQRIRAFVEAGLGRKRPAQAAVSLPEVPEQEEWERELRASESRKSAILDCALDGIITMNLEGRITEFNRAAERMFGYERAQVIGKTIAETIVPPSLRERHRRGLARYLATGEPVVLGRRIELPGLRADGTEFPVELAIATTQTDGQRVFTAYVRDISDRQRAELGQAVQNATTRVLAEAPDLAAAAPRILQAICESLGWDLGALWTVDRRSDALRCVEVWHAPGTEFPEFTAMAQSRTLLRGAGLLGRVCAAGKPVWSTRVAGDSDFLRAAAAEKDGLRAAVAFPILLGGECLGVMEFLSRHDRAGDDDLLQKFAAIGSQIGQYMERKRAEEEVRRSEERFRALVENSTDVIALLSREGTNLYATPSQTRVLGLTPEENRGRNVFENVHPDDASIAQERFAKLLASPGVPVTAEVRVQHKDGSWRVLEAVGVNRLDDPSVRAIVANYRDITARKQAESLQAALYRVSEATSVTRDVGELYAEIHAIVAKLMPAENFYIALYDEAAKIVTFPYFVDAVDPKPEPKKLGKGLTDYVLRTGEPLLATPERFAQLQKTGEVKLIGGSSLDWLGVPLKTDDRNLGVLVVQTYTKDVRYGEREKEVLAFVAQHIAGAIARKRAEQEIKRSVSLLQSSIESTADGLLVVNSEGGVVAFNQRFAHLWRIPPELMDMRDDSALVAHVLDQLKSPDQFIDKIKELYSRPEAEAFDVLEFKDGRVFERYSTPQRQDGEPVGRVWSFRDVTERTQAEQALRQTEKLAAMGSLLAGVAHELNNPLSVILGHAELLRRTAGSGPLAQKADQIAQAAGRCASIVGNFLALARQRPPERRRVALNEVVREVLDIVTYPLRMDGVDVVLDLDPELPILVGDPHQLHQVVLNLMTNAQDAMRGTDGPRMMVVGTSFDEATKRLCLEVSDTGPGIPAEVRSRLFEPFFTTKPQGQGTGLGLSLCQGIVENHGGTIRAESEEGKGALFRVELPLELRSDAEPEAPAAGHQRNRGGKILVVDDEAHVASVLAEMLAVDGHLIDVAQNGALALDRLRQSSYDLVLSDIRMPELDGLGLYQEVRRLHPEMAGRFVFLTGDRLSSETGKFLATAGAPSLSKPFHLDEVLSVVRRMLQAR